MSKFKSDLSFGESGEKHIINYITTKGLQFKGRSIDIEPSSIAKYDLLFLGKKGEVFVEVKTDKYINDSFDTKNIIVEMSCGGKPSGISTTKADIWVNYFINKKKDNVWSIKVKDLKNLIDIEKHSGGISIKSGGDNNKTRLWVIPRFEYQHLFYVDTWVTP